MMNIEPFILPSPPTPSGQPLSVAAKRYRYGGKTPPNGITLLLFHGLGQRERSVVLPAPLYAYRRLDKEQWEPILDKLFTLQSAKSAFQQIREAWSFDWQSHGESAVLNEDAVKDDPKSARTFSGYSPQDLSFIPSTALDLWGYAIAQFLKSGLFTGRRLVGIGYSFGTVGL